MILLILMGRDLTVLTGNDLTVGDGVHFVRLLPLSPRRLQQKIVRRVTYSPFHIFP